MATLGKFSFCPNVETPRPTGLCKYKIVLKGKTIEGTNTRKGISGVFKKALDDNPNCWPYVDTFFYINGEKADFVKAICDPKGD